MGFRMAKIFLTSSDLYGENMFDLGLPLKVKGQGQTLKTLMSKCRISQKRYEIGRKCQ